MRRPGSHARARQRGGDRRRGRPPRPVLRRRHVRGVSLCELVARAALDVLAGRAGGLEPYEQAVARRITPLTAAGWGAKVAFERFPRTTFALARLPITLRTVEKLLQGELGHPGAARGIEKAAIRLIYAVARRAGDPGRAFHTAPA